MAQKLDNLIKNKKKDPNEYKDLYEKHDYVFIKEISYINSHIIQLLHKKDRKKVICKVVEINNVITRKDIDEFIKKENDVMQDLDHSNIEGFLKFLTDGTQIYQISNYYEAGTLRQLSNKRKLSKQPFNFNEAFAIFIQILDGLAYLNSKNLILEYLNMDDIYINNGKLKITNFGKEKRKFNISSLTSTPVNRRQVERRFYNAPEKLRGQPLTIKVDTWCLGCLLYEICTFEIIDDDFKLEDKIKLPHLYTRHPFIEDSIGDIMNKDPLQRISTVDLLERLVVYDTFIYPNIDILNEEEKVIGFEEIYDHIEMKKLRDEIEMKNDVYISYCYEDEPYIKDLLDNLVGYFQDELNYNVVFSDNKEKKNKYSSIDIADAIMSSAVFIPLLTKAYSQSTSCKHELTIAKIAVEKFIVLQLESDLDQLECAMNCLIASQKIYKAAAYDSEQDFRKQWLWFDNFLNSIEELRSEKNINQNPCLRRAPAPDKPAQLINTSFKCVGFVFNRMVEIELDKHAKELIKRNLPTMEEGANEPDKQKHDAYEWENKDNLSKTDKYIQLAENYKEIPKEISKRKRIVIK